MAPVHCERQCSEQATPYRLVQQQTVSFMANTEASTGGRP
jgi:hypothetical protein